MNAAILVLSAAVFHGKAEVASIEEAHRLLPGFLGAAAPILFGVALLCAGQSSTLTGTLAGQIIMEGYLDLKLAPWLRRLITRSLALIPAVLTIALVGEESTQHLLVLSQVVLSLQLSFAVIPLIHFTSDRRNMGEFATPWWGRVLAWASATIIVGLNAKLVGRQDRRVGPAWPPDRAGRSARLPLSWLVGGALYGVAFSALGLLAWVTIKPFVRPAPTWKPEPPVELDWADALRPRQPGPDRRRPGARAGRRRDPQPGPGAGRARPDLAGLAPRRRHPDDPRLRRRDPADRETGADERYLAEVVQVLERDKGYRPGARPAPRPRPRPPS